MQRDLLLVGEWQGRIVATVMAGFDGHRGWLYRIAVDTAVRRHGFGRQMVEVAERKLSELGCTKINLMVRQTNRQVVAFYHSLGYEVEELIHMGKRLPQTGLDEKIELKSVRIPVNNRIELTEFRPSDRADLLEFLNNREIYDCTLRIPFPYTNAHFDQWLNIVSQSIAQHGQPVHFALREPAGRVIGCCGFDGLTPGHRAEIGYWLAQPYWGQGLMTAVVHAACQHAFTQWKLVRMTAHVFDFNIASARVLEKNGFVREGHLKKHYFKNGQAVDGFTYALLR